MKEDLLREALSQLDDELIERGMQPAPQAKKRISYTFVALTIAAELMIAAVGTYALLRERPTILDIGESSLIVTEATTFLTTDHTDTSTPHSTDPHEKVTVTSAVSGTISSKSTPSVVTVQSVTQLPNGQIDPNGNQTQNGTKPKTDKSTKTTTKPQSTTTAIREGTPGTYDPQYFSWDAKKQKFTYIGEYSESPYDSTDDVFVDFTGQTNQSLNDLLAALRRDLNETCGGEEGYAEFAANDPQKANALMSPYRQAAIDNFVDLFAYPLTDSSYRNTAAVLISHLLGIDGKLNETHFLRDGAFYLTQANNAVQAVQKQLTPKQVEALQEVFGYMIAPALQQCGKLELLSVSQQDVTAQQLVAFVNNFSRSFVSEIIEQNNYPIKDSTHLSTTDIENFATLFGRYCYDVRVGTNTNPNFARFTDNPRLLEYLQSWAVIQRNQLGLDSSFRSLTQLEMDSVTWYTSSGNLYNPDGRSMPLSIQRPDNPVSFYCVTDDFETVLLHMCIMPSNHTFTEHIALNEFSILLQKQDGVVRIVDFQDQLFQPQNDGNVILTQMANGVSTIRSQYPLSLYSADFWNTALADSELSVMKQFADTSSAIPPYHQELYDYLLNHLQEMFDAGTEAQDSSSNVLYLYNCDRIRILDMYNRMVISQELTADCFDYENYLYTVMIWKDTSSAESDAYEVSIVYYSCLSVYADAETLNVRLRISHDADGYHYTLR